MQILLKNFRRVTELKSISFIISREVIIFGITHNKDQVTNINNLILLTIKAYIYRMRCFNKSLSLIALLRELKTTLLIQDIKASKHNRNLDENIKRWEILLQSLDILQSS